MGMCLFFFIFVKREKLRSYGYWVIILRFVELWFFLKMGRSLLLFLRIKLFMF